MTESIFTFLQGIGYSYPLHPVFLYLPMGMAAGAFVFRAAAFMPRLRFLSHTAYHCTVLGFIGVIPAIFTGYLDWQHSYQGKLDLLISLKLLLALAMLVLPVLVMVTDKAKIPGFNKTTLFYLLIAVAAAGLMFAGFGLQYA
ncbi:MAG: hypothetical protein K9J83_03070 [Desulfarculaceae bacterium]|nr:hypothetical protein [Desulfarculaceae bacterium]